MEGLSSCLWQFKTNLWWPDLRAPKIAIANCRVFCRKRPLGYQTALRTFFGRKKRKSRRNRFVVPSQPKTAMYFCFWFIIIIIIIIITFVRVVSAEPQWEGQSDPLCRCASMSWYPIICFSSKSITSLWGCAKGAAKRACGKTVVQTPKNGQQQALSQKPAARLPRKDSHFLDQGHLRVQILHAGCL